VLESDRIEKVGHNLKFDLSVLKWHGISVRGKFFDTMVAHSSSSRRCATAWITSPRSTWATRPSRSAS